MGISVNKTVVSSSEIENASIEPGANLRVVTANVCRTPDFYGYRSMFERALCELADDLDGLRRVGYRPYIFLPGASLTAQWMSENRAYDLATALVEAGIKALAGTAVDIASGDRRRRIGLYRIDEADLVSACMLQSAKPPCCIAFSRDGAFLSDDTLRGLYHANGLDDLSALRAPSNWRGVAHYLCAARNVLLRATGAFDDLTRSVSVISRQSETG